MQPLMAREKQGRLPYVCACVCVCVCVRARRFVRAAYKQYRGSVSHHEGEVPGLAAHVILCSEPHSITQYAEQGPTHHRFIHTFV